MSKIRTNPECLTQNLHAEVAGAQSNQAHRIRLYRRLLDRAFGRLEARRLTVIVPRLRGLRRRGGAPFHATPELFFQQEGSTLFEMPEEQFTVASGEVCLMPRAMPHAETAHGGRRPFLTLITMFWPDGFSLHFGHATPERHVHSDPHDRFLMNTPFITQCLDEVASALDRPGESTDDYVHNLLLVVLCALLAGLGRPHAKKPPGQDLVGRCQALIEQHLNAKQVSVTWLARHLGCTPDHLSRAFQRRTGATLVNSINRLRIEHAIRLMHGDEFNIGEIAWATGYATQSYFNRLFRRQMGMTPRQYRASIAGLRRFIPGAACQTLSTRC